MQTPNVLIENVSLAYNSEPVFSNLHLELKAGQWVCLLGRSGIGKSSLLRMIAGLTTEQETISGKISSDNNKPVAQQIAYMAQTDLLLPWLTVLENATLGLKLQYHEQKQADKIRDRTKFLLDEAGLSKFHHYYPQQLSGGMRQRVALVRTLMQDKPLVLMDEPFSALDAITRYQLQELAHALLKEKSVFFITHDPTEALRLADVIYIMSGQPANLQLAAALSSPAPRDLQEPEVIRLQAQLFQTLALAQENSA